MTGLLSTDQAFIDRLSEIILTNLQNENFGVNDLARETGLSRFIIHRRLSTLRHQNITQFIRELRLKRALELMQQNAGTASDIAFKVGFGSPSYFNKCFHEYYGYPPGEFKKRGFEIEEEYILPPGTPKQKPKEANLRTFIYLSLAILFFASTAYLVYSFFLRNNSSDTGSLSLNSEKSIALLPFETLSNSIDDQYFIEGVIDEIYINLNKISELRVISRISAEKYINTSKSVTEIAKKLGANYIIRGSGQKYGNSFRFRVYLIDALKDRQLWSKSYEVETKDIKDIFKLQSQVAQNIASELEATIAPEEKQLIEKYLTTSLTAYFFYFRGKDELNKYNQSIPSTRNSIDRASAMYRKALEYDPEFAQAYVGIAQVFWRKHYWETFLSESFLDSVLILVNKALSIDDQLAEAYTIKGNYYFEKGLPEMAITEYDKALKYNPNDCVAYFEKGNAYALLNDYVKCLDNLHKAVIRNRGIDLAEYIRKLAYYYMVAGFEDKAKHYYSEAFTLHGDSVLLLEDLAWSEFNNENFTVAFQLAKKKKEIDSSSLIAPEYYQFLPSSDNQEAYISAKEVIHYFDNSGEFPVEASHRIAIALWRVEKKKEAVYYFNRQIKYSEESIKLGRKFSRQGGAYYELAGVNAFLGNKMKAYEYLDELNKMKIMPYLKWGVLIKYDPLFESLRGEKRFQQITGELEKIYLSEHERVGKWLEEQGMI